jgi:tetratricopeptide (TPR) repeat protein
VRAATESDAVDDLIELCARLPLALNITAARAAAHPTIPLAMLAGQLHEAHGRLDALDAGDTAANTRAVFSWSYRTLRGESARMFRLLGAHPGPDITVPAAASLTAATSGQARGALEELARIHLLSEHAPGRYAFHDLLRAYAIELGCTQDDGRERALRRAVDHYLHTAAAGHRLLMPLQRSPTPLPEPAAGVATQPLPDVGAALAWFDQEHDCLRAIQQLASTHGWDAEVCLLAWAMDGYHSRRVRLHDRASSWRLALAAAERLDDPGMRALAHQNIARAHLPARENTDALSHLRHALTLAEKTGDVEEQARAHYLMAAAWDQDGDQRQALDHADRALHLFGATNNAVWQANTLNAMGWYQISLGRYAEAQDCCESALALHRLHLPGNGDDAATLDTLGLVAHHLGDHDRALDYYHQALDQCRDDGDTFTEADVLDHLAETHLALGRRVRAHHAWKHAHDLYQVQYRLTDAQRVSRKIAATVRDESHH